MFIGSNCTSKSNPTSIPASWCRGDCSLKYSILQHHRHGTTTNKWLKVNFLLDLQHFMYFIFILLYFDNQCLDAWADGSHVDVSVKNMFTGLAWSFGMLSESWTSTGTSLFGGTSTTTCFKSVIFQSRRISSWIQSFVDAYNLAILRSYIKLLFGPSWILVDYGLVELF